MSVAVLAPPDQIRLHRAPPIDPPFDDELFPSLFQPHLHEAYFDSSPLVTAGSSQEGHAAALRFLNLCVELFNGFRSPSQMRPLLDLQHVFNLHDELADIARHLSRFRRPRSKVKVRRTQLRTCEPVPGVIEVAAVLSDGIRTWALCYRIERQKADWRCTFLRALLPPHDPVAGPHARRPIGQQQPSSGKPTHTPRPQPAAPTAGQQPRPTRSKADRQPHSTATTATSGPRRQSATAAAVTPTQPAAGDPPPERFQGAAEAAAGKRRRANADPAVAKRPRAATSRSAAEEDAVRASDDTTTADERVSLAKQKGAPVVGKKRNTAKPKTA